ncbi:MAG: ATP-binding cassette domain-containing protein [Thermoplasmataceae archaeon]
MPGIIETHNLSKVYFGKIKAVDNLNIEIEEGEIYGLLGPNGAGKTTTINMLTTRISPTSGTALVAGHDITRESMSVRRLIGVVPQDLTADEDLTGRENMIMVSQFYDVPRATANDRIARLLKLVDLEEAANRYVRGYSGGMRKRLELILGLINDPKILFLDEPTLGLDVQTRTQMWNYVRDIQEKLNVTIILTSHYLEEIDALADRVSIIDHGHVLVTGSPEDLKKSLKGDVITITFKDREEVEVMKRFDGSSESSEIGVNSLRIKVPNADEYLPKIINFISENKLSTLKLTVQKPSLDEVFLEYTGRDIRAEDGGDVGDVRKMMMNMRRVRR